jgi:hypothetical protein
MIRWLHLISTFVVIDLYGNASIEAFHQVIFGLDPQDLITAVVAGIGAWFGVRT